MLPVRQYKTKSNVNLYISPSVESVDCHGMSVEEMLEAVGKAIDNCIVNNSEKLSIIHGIGHGILRNSLYKYLNELLDKGDVKRWVYGGMYNDDPAITVVYL